MVTKIREKILSTSAITRLVTNFYFIKRFFLCFRIPIVLVGNKIDRNDERYYINLILNRIKIKYILPSLYEIICFSE